MTPRGKCAAFLGKWGGLAGKMRSIRRQRASEECLPFQPSLPGLRLANPQSWSCRNGNSRAPSTAFCWISCALRRQTSHGTIEPQKKLKNSSAQSREKKKAAGEPSPPSRSLTGPGLAPALGLRAGTVALFILLQTYPQGRRKCRMGFLSCLHKRRLP
jgi:hypothetical protein